MGEKKLDHAGYGEAVIGANHVSGSFLPSLSPQIQGFYKRVIKLGGGDYDSEESMTNTLFGNYLCDVPGYVGFRPIVAMAVAAKILKIINSKVK